MPIVTPHGTAIAVRSGHMTAELMAELNKSAQHLISVGLWQPGEESGQPPQEE
ncbi:hypothetical protein [Streptomyces sp. NPDC086182]|uniref:hypothetical protein n=1 Tax=Streptomyces sp. NPDC086182 TaxID=3155058 RepID=UPI003421CC07